MLNETYMVCFIRTNLSERCFMKLSLLFAVMDVLILLAYPVVYITHLIRKKMGVK